MNSIWIRPSDNRLWSDTVWPPKEPRTRTSITPSMTDRGTFTQDSVPAGNTRRSPRSKPSGTSMSRSACNATQSFAPNRIRNLRPRYDAIAPVRGNSSMSSRRVACRRGWYVSYSGLEAGLLDTADQFNSEPCQFVGLEAECFGAGHLRLPRPVELAVQNNFRVPTTYAIDPPVAELLVPVVGQTAELLQFQRAPQAFESGLVDIAFDVNDQDIVHHDGSLSSN